MFFISTCFHSKAFTSIITYKIIILRNPDFTLKRFSTWVPSCRLELIILAINVQVNTIIVFEKNFHEWNRYRNFHTSCQKLIKPCVFNPTCWKYAKRDTKINRQRDCLMCAYFDQLVLFVYTKVIKHMETYRQISIKTLPYDR